MGSTILNPNPGQMSLMPEMATAHTSPYSPVLFPDWVYKSNPKLGGNLRKYAESVHF